MSTQWKFKCLTCFSSHFLACVRGENKQISVLFCFLFVWVKDTFIAFKFISGLDWFSYEHLWTVGSGKSSGFRCTWIYTVFKDRVNANMSISKMVTWYLLLSPRLCPVIFYLNGFNSVLTSCCQRTEMAWPLSFSSHQSFIITRIHQPIPVITDYRQPVIWRDQGNTHLHTHTLPSDFVSCQESETHLHIRRSETCAPTPPSFQRGAT